MAVCLRYALTLGAGAGAVLFLGADFLASAWLKTPETALSLRVLALGLPFLSASSCLNGYFTAVRKAARFAATQVLEQALRIGVTVASLGLFLPFGSAYACVALVIGSCVAEVTSTAVAYGIYRLTERGPSRQGGPLLRALLHIAAPDAAGSWIRSALVTAKNLLIPRGLRLTGASAGAALATYGVIQGMALPIIAFPSALLGALSGLLVPEVAESRALGRWGHIRYIIDRVTHITLLFSIAAAGLIFVYATPLAEALYPGRGVAPYLRLLAPIIPVMYLDMMVDGVLKGLGLQVASMRYNIIDAAMSLTLVWQLIPRFGVWGYVITIYASELLNFYLSMGKLIKVADVRPGWWRRFVKPAFAVAASALCAGSFLALAGRFASPAWALALAMAGCLGFYTILLALMRCITGEDIRWAAGILKK
jgi:stage V sporulation protein B